MAAEDTKETTPIDFQEEFKQVSEKVTTEFASALSALGSSFRLRPQEEKDDGECCFMYVDDDAANKIRKKNKENVPEAKDGDLLSPGQQTPTKSRDNKSPYIRSSPMARMRDTEEQKSSELKEKSHVTLITRSSFLNAGLRFRDDTTSCSMVCFRRTITI